jgi:septal ring factor EnvC (AmiA/AmiB activator)
LTDSRALHDAGPKDEAARKLHATEQARAANLQAQAASARAAAAAAAREAALATQRVQAAGRLRTIETNVQTAADRVRDAQAAQQSAEDAVAQRTEALSSLLPLALRLSRYPAEMLLAAPVPADQAIEGVLVTQGVSADIARQVLELRQQQAQAKRLAESTGRRQAALAAERARQAQAAAALDTQIAAAGQARTVALDQGAAAAEAASALAAKANDLRSAIAAMDEAERQAAARAAQQAALAQAQLRRHKSGAVQAAVPASTPAGPGLSDAAPKVTLVAGRITRQFGAASDDGPATGISFSVTPGAFVSSPCAGRVAFAAPFRSYGRLMIIECGGGYDFVLSGMARLDAAVGHSVRPGEPIGRMADAGTASGAGKPVLYVELRKGGQPVNPMPYLNGRS